MAYPIVFQTKMIQLYPDGRILHLWREGSSDDKQGRQPDVYNCQEIHDDGDGYIREISKQIYVKNNETFSQYWERYQKPEMKLYNRWCSRVQYGEHLIRMTNRYEWSFDIDDRYFVSAFIESPKNSGNMISLTKFDDIIPHIENHEVMSITLVKKHKRRYNRRNQK